MQESQMTEQESTRAGDVAGADYFMVFSLPRLLGLDPKALERNFYRLSRAVHPDRFARASPEKQQWSLEQTSLLNDAYRALKHPLSRVEYLLRLEGVTIPGEDSAERSASKAPPELLEEVFELNMQLEEMRENRATGAEDAQLRVDLERAQAQFEAMLAGIDGEIEGASVRWDQAAEEAARKGALVKLAALLDKRRYVKNLVRDVGEALR